jgi:hypothetical protein
MPTFEIIGAPPPVLDMSHPLSAPCGPVAAQAPCLGVFVQVRTPPSQNYDLSRY